MIAHKKTYTGITIHLDGGSYYHCTFHKCRLVISGVLPFEMEHCTFDECTWGLAGPAQTAIMGLAALYQIPGMAPVIEATFNTIRGKPAPGPTLFKH